ARAAERPHWLRWSLACYFQIAGGAPALPLGPLRSPVKMTIFSRTGLYADLQFCIAPLAFTKVDHKACEPGEADKEEQQCCIF
ncbi:hypothetical protein, partial [Prosthecobacter sp.]|uniref:hypothetical protein n=1 Tax=Prosthecobacter sp. TaxID=1965333 RepID=UPI003784E240